MVVGMLKFKKEEKFRNPNPKPPFSESETTGAAGPGWRTFEGGRFLSTERGRTCYSNYYNWTELRGPLTG